MLAALSVHGVHMRARTHRHTHSIKFHSLYGEKILCTACELIMFLGTTYVILDKKDTVIGLEKDRKQMRTAVLADTLKKMMGWRRNEAEQAKSLLRATLGPRTE